MGQLLHHFASRQRYLLVALTLLGAFLRFETVTQRPMWYDETYTWNVASTAPSLLSIWDKAHLDGAEHPPLFYSLVYISKKVFSDLFALRVPSLLVGTLSVPLLAALGATLANRAVGLGAGFLLAISVYHIEYSQDGRSYALLVFLSILSHYLLTRVAESRNFFWPPLGALVLGALLHTHHIGLLALPSALVLALLLTVRAQEKRPLVTRFFLTFFGAFLLYLPAAVFLQEYQSTSNWDAKHVLAPSLQLGLEVSARWTFGWSLKGLLLLLSLLGAGRALYRRELNAISILGVLAPFGAFSLIPFGKFFDIRFVIQALPFFLLLLAEGIESVAAFWRPALLYPALLVAFAIPSLQSYLLFRKTDMRCSNFFYISELLTRDEHFCERQLILNSLNPNHAFLLKRVSPDAP